MHKQSSKGRQTMGIAFWYFQTLDEQLITS